MQFIRFILLLPIKIITLLLRIITFILRPIIGRIDFTWSAPGWLFAVGNFIRKRWKSVSIAVPAIALLCYGVYWYKNLPPPPIPNLVSLYSTAPRATYFSENEPAKIYPLIVNFSGSAAPLEKVGKTFTNEFSIQPAIKGEWHWINDHSLQFQPKIDWTPGQTYIVDFSDKSKFNPNVIIRNSTNVQDKNITVRFTTSPFDASISKSSFTQDDQDPKIKKGVFKLSFNMPVDPVSLEKNTNLTLVSYKPVTYTSILGNKSEKKYEEITKTIPFTVSYDKKKLTATISSANLPIPEYDSKLTLSVSDKVQRQSGKETLHNGITSYAPVPSRYTLAVNDVSTSIVTDAHNKSDQVLNIEFNSPVNDAQVARNISAWILPNDTPFGDLDQLTPKTLSHFKPVTLTLIPAENNAQTLQSFKYQIQPDQELLVQINTGIQSTGGYVLSKQYRKSLSAPDYPKRLNFMSDGALLSLHGENKVSVVSQNLTGIKMQIAQLRPNQLQHLVSLRNDDGYNKVYFSGDFSEDHISNLYQQTVNFQDNSSHDIRYNGFDLSSYLHNGLRGVFVLKLSEFDKNAEIEAQKNKKEQQQTIKQRTYAIGTTPETDNGDDDNNDDDKPVEDTRLVVITDLGILVKKNLDGSQDVFIQSINEGSPVANAEVSVVGLNGEKLMTQTTNSTGTVHFDALNGFSNDKKPIMYVVTKADDLSFLPINERDRQLDLSRFNIGGKVNSIHPGEISAYLFSDRGIYRTGDDYHIGIITKAAKWDKDLTGLPLKLIVTDPTGKSYEHPIRLDINGFNNFNDTIPDDAPNGNWNFSLQTIDPKDKDWSQQIGSTNIKVKDFMPEQTRVSSKFSEENTQGWVKPDQLKAIVEAQNLFGTPAPNRKVSATLNLMPFVPNFDKWKKYHFSDPHDLQSDFEETLQDQTTNDKGQAVFDLDLKKYSTTSYNLYFTANVFEPNSGRSVTSTSNINISNNDYLIGYASDDDLDNIKVNSHVSPINFIAINPKADKIAVSNLKLQLIEHRYISVLVKQDSGLYKYESKKRDIVLKEEPFSITQNGTNYEVYTQKGGDYSITILDKDNRKLNNIDYSVIGVGNVAGNLDRNSELKIQLDKKTYKAGDQIQIAIRAPYTGSGIITIEKEKVYAHTWFHTDTTNTIQYITVPDNLVGNGYVNVQFVRDPSSEEIFMSPLSYGVQPFAVDLSEYQNPLTIDAPKVTKDRQLTFTLHADHPTRAVLWAVDEGILQVAKYKLKDPLTFFYSKKMLSVKTLQILDQILPEFSQILKLNAASGGDAADRMMALSAQVNPFKRKVDKAIVFWSGIVDVDGDKEFTYKVPDYFNGTLRVMAMSVSGEQIGIQNVKTIVRDDFVLKPNAPTTLTPGDETVISVMLSNNLDQLNGKKIPITVAIKTTSQFQVIGSSNQTVTLGEKQEANLQFRIKALDHNLGSGDLIFTATADNASVTNTTHVLLRPASTYRTKINMNNVEAGKTATFDDLRHVYPNDAVYYASFSDLPTVLMQGLSTYLVDYTHLCSEQIVSRAFALLAIQNNPGLKRLFVTTHIQNIPDLDKTINGIITKLQERQNDVGGFGLWRSTSDTDNFVTSYVTFFLQNALDNGKPVSLNTLKKAYSYLQDYALHGSASSLADMRNRAFAIYLLTKHGIVTSNAITSLVEQLNTHYKQEWQNDTTAAWLAASMKMMKQDEEANKMMQGPLQKLQRKTAKQVSQSWFGNDYVASPLSQDATTLYLVAENFPEKLPKLSPNALENILYNIEQRNYDTLSASLTMLAFDAYQHHTAGNEDQLSIQAVQNLIKDNQKQQITLANSYPKDGFQILTWKEPTTSLIFDNHSDHKAWYTIIQRGYNRNVPTTAVKDHMEIIHEYTDKNNKPISVVKIGQEMIVHVKFRSTDGHSYNNIAITDLLPGGFDMVDNNTVATSEDDQNSDSNDNDSDQSVASNTDDNNGWTPDFVNKKEDQVIIYGTITPDVHEYTYRIKATNEGKYILPPAYGEGMYNQSIQARSVSGQYITVTAP